MNRTIQPRVFVLGKPRDVPMQVPLRLACEQAGIPESAIAEPAGWPRLGAALRARGASAMLAISESSATDPASHWLDAEHARGWVSPQAGRDIDADTLPVAWQALLALGHVPADAALLAWPSLPRLSWDGDRSWLDAPPRLPRSASYPPLGLYAIVDNVDALRNVLAAGVRTVQLRIKRPPDADAAWTEALRAAVRDGVAAAEGHGALLVVNDHWRLAAESGARAVHLGQEDLLALGEASRAELSASGLDLGISSHAAWELCRAQSLAPRYIACGPVWPTTTKDMPWQPQGLDNLSFWCRAAQAPVVAIGGILTPRQVRQTAAVGASGVCVLRGLGSGSRLAVAPLLEAFEEGRQVALTNEGTPAGEMHPALGSAT